MSSLEMHAQAPAREARRLGAVRPVAGVSAVVVALLCLRHGLGVDVVFGAAFVAALAVIAVVDIEERRIPNRLVLPASALTAATVFVLHRDELTASVVAGLAAFLFFFVPALLTPKTVGMGDAKLALLVGLGLGSDALLGFFATSFVAGAVALAVILKRGSGARKEGLPFAPFLALGAAVALVAGGGALYA